MKTNLSSNEVVIGIYRYNERELSQIIRRKMISKSFKNKKKYNRKSNNKNYGEYID